MKTAEEYAQQALRCVLRARSDHDALRELYAHAMRIGARGARWADTHQIAMMNESAAKYAREAVYRARAARRAGWWREDEERAARSAVLSVAQCAGYVKSAMNECKK